MPKTCIHNIKKWQLAGFKYWGNIICLFEKIPARAKSLIQNILLISTYLLRGRKILIYLTNKYIENNALSDHMYCDNNINQLVLFFITRFGTFVLIFTIINTYTKILLRLMRICHSWRPLAKYEGA